MKVTHVNFKRDWRLIKGTKRSQAAEMVISPGDGEGGPNNTHKGSDQWLYVVHGKGEAIVKGKKISLKAGTLLLIQPSEAHEIRNTGKIPLKTFNFYAPPEY
jgi:mannose-6-phosphate isomerase-like protein (cupin superfamily)